MLPPLPSTAPKLRVFDQEIGMSEDLLIDPDALGRLSSQGDTKSEGTLVTEFVSDELKLVELNETWS